MVGYVLFVGYIVGLLLTGLSPAWIVGSFNVFGGPTIDVTTGMGVSLMAGAIASLLAPRFWRMGPSRARMANGWLYRGGGGDVFASAIALLRQPPTRYFD